MSWCIVLLTGVACADYPGMTCVMGVLGPYGTRAEAVTAARQQPEWAAPHIMRLQGET